MDRLPETLCSIGLEILVPEGRELPLRFTVKFHDYPWSLGASPFEVQQAKKEVTLPAGAVNPGHHCHSPLSGSDQWLGPAEVLTGCEGSLGPVAEEGDGSLLMGSGGCGLLAHPHLSGVVCTEGGCSPLVDVVTGGN